VYDALLTAIYTLYGFLSELSWLRGFSWVLAWDMETVINPHGLMEILWGVLNGSEIHWKSFEHYEV